MRKLGCLIFFVVLLAVGGLGYYTLLVPNISNGKKAWVKIPTGSSYEDVLRLLSENRVLKNQSTFEIVSLYKDYPNNIIPGYYVFNRNMNNRQILNMLRWGRQTPVTLSIYNIRTKEEFAGLLGRTFEIDSNRWLKKLNDPEFCKAQGVDTNTILTRIIVDNYQNFWNIGMDGFFVDINTSYNNFWNEEREKKADAIHLTPAQVTILASIVEKEVIRDKELPTVASVYLNRLKIGMALQADPTLVFALRDFDARRVNQRHKEFDSPYNTYMYPGLPPGPICMPRKKSIDAVLNPEQHDFLYFCANPDMSGYSIFSKTLEEQNKTAVVYRKKLNKMNVH